MDLPAVVDHVSGPELPAWQPGDAWLAGGTLLFSEPQPGIRRLLDLTTLGWPPITIHPGGLEIAATCTVADLVRTPLPPRWRAAPLVRRCCEAFLASFKVWNVATVGGNVCAALPAGPMIALAAALAGTGRVISPDGSVRDVPITQLVVGPGTTTLAPGDVLRSIDLPAAALRSPVAVRQASLRNLGRSAALIVGRRDRRHLVLTVTAATSHPVVLQLPARPDAAQLRAAIEAGIPPEAYHDDVHGDPDWRQHLTLRLAEEIRAELAAIPATVS